jgi:hypothetical protein
MAVKLHRCKNQWVKGPHPCWRVEKALIDSGIEYERVPEAWLGERKTMVEDGRWYREESKDMAEAIRAGRLEEMRGKTPATRTAA